MMKSHLHCLSQRLRDRQTAPTTTAPREPGSQDQTSGWVSSALWSSSSEPSAWTPHPGSLHSSPGCQALKCDSSGVIQEPGLQGPSGSDPISPRELASQLGRGLLPPPSTALFPPSVFPMSPPLALIFLRLHPEALPPCLSAPTLAPLSAAQEGQGSGRGCHAALASSVPIRVTVDRNMSHRKMDAGFVP